MKTKAIVLILSLFMGTMGLYAQQRVTVKATNYDISDNLDLEAVASMFGDASNLEDFERNLNDPEIQISNLDLNEDGFVDYLRVVESTEDGLHLILIQAVLAKDIYQDVATIDVEKRGSEVVVQIVGNSYIYGTNYIIEPVYVRRPVIFTHFWGPSYVRWVSPYYYGYYPVYYHRWAPRPAFVYHRHVHHHVHTYHTYRHVSVRKSNRAYQMYKRHGRNDYARTNPARSFEKRNAGVQNRQQLTANRSTANTRTRTAQKRSVETRRTNTATVKSGSVSSRPTQTTISKSRTVNSRPSTVKSTSGLQTRSATVRTTTTRSVNRTPDRAIRANSTRTSQTTRSTARNSTSTSVRKTYTAPKARQAKASTSTRNTSRSTPARTAPAQSRSIGLNR